MREGEENGSGLDSERFRTPVLYMLDQWRFRPPAFLRTVKDFVRRIYRVSHRYRASVRARRLNRRRLASGLGTFLQPATRVPSLRHSGFNGTNDNRHPCLRRSFADVQSANPSLHSSIQLKNNVPENTKRQKTKDKRQKTKDKRQKTKDKRQKIFSIFLFSFNCLSLGRESRRYRDVPAEFGAPWMGDTKP